MWHLRFALIVVVGLLSFCGSAAAQSSGILYTWPGTGDTADWVNVGSNFSTVANSSAGHLTVTELGDEFNPSIVGGVHIIRDGLNRRLEASAAPGGLDVTGLDALEVDLQHSGPGTVNVQFFLQATPGFNYVWAGSDGILNGADWAVGPGVHTLRFPLGLLSSSQQAHIRTLGLSIRDHFAQGNVTWHILEVRKVGVGLNSRVLASHDAGSSDNGLNGAFVNFDQAAVVGNGGNQNQTGLSQMSNGSVGSLQWTDKGNGGNTEVVSGAAVSWVNGTAFNGNTFNERLADFSNYGTVTFRMSAADAFNGGGNLEVQAFFQTGALYTYQTTGVGSFGELDLPIDGQYHDLVFPLASVTSLFDVDAFGVNLGSHTNNLVIQVDSVIYSRVPEPATFGLVGMALVSLCGLANRTKRSIDCIC